MGQPSHGGSVVAELAAIPEGASQQKLSLYSMDLQAPRCPSPRGPAGTCVALWLPRLMCSLARNLLS